MFLWWTRRLWSSTVSVSVCCHAAVFLLLTRSCEGQYQMVGPSTPVLAMLGVDVVLPCHLEPAADETKSTVEWSRSDLNPRLVHLRRDGVDLLISKHPSYAGRTNLSSSRLKLGDLSLRLSNVKLSDEGKYTYLLFFVRASCCLFCGEPMRASRRT
uniref:Immunoglobulin V-set domain-containing protein n=1 Tax=Salarias fasciatus TaxID=181472 RepID=A0A672HJZ7_SALFA